MIRVSWVHTLVLLSSVPKAPAEVTSSCLGRHPCPWLLHLGYQHHWLVCTYQSLRLKWPVLLCRSRLILHEAIGHFLPFLQWIMVCFHMRLTGFRVFSLRTSSYVITVNVLIIKNLEVDFRDSGLMVYDDPKLWSIRIRRFKRFRTVVPGRPSVG